MGLAFFTRDQWWTLGIAATRIVAFIGLQKVVALEHGPNGIFFLGQFMLLQWLCYGLVTDGLNRAMMVQAGRENDAAHRSSLLAHGAKAVAVLMLVMAVLVCWGMPLFLPMATTHTFPMALALAAGGLFWWAAPTLQFERRPISLWLATALQGAMIVAAALVPSAYFGWFGLPMGTDELYSRLFLIAIGQALASIGVAIPYFIQLRTRGKSMPVVSTWNLLSHFASYGGLSLAILLAGPGADLWVRSWAMGFMDIDSLGIWQASVRLGDLAFAPFIPLFGSLFFAEATKLTRPQLAHALRGQMRLAMLGVAGIGLTVFVGPWLLPILNRADFAAGIAYYRWQAPGDVVRMLTFPISIAMLAIGRLRALAWLEAISLLTYIVGAYVLGHWLGALGLALAHTLRYCVFALVTLWVARDLLIEVVRSDNSPRGIS